MTNVSLVERKLGLIVEPIRRLKARRPHQQLAFETDTLLQNAIAMGVLVVVQEALDISLHIASDEGWELGATYREAFLGLAKHGVKESELAISLGQIAQLRNRIAHGYATLDAARLWAERPGGIVAFEAFASAIATFLLRAT